MWQSLWAVLFLSSCFCVVSLFEVPKCAGPLRGINITASVFKLPQLKLTLQWPLPKEFSGCTYNYSLTFDRYGESRLTYNTTDNSFTWHGNSLCSIQVVHLGLQELNQDSSSVGSFASINVTKLFEDNNSLSLDVSFNRTKTRVYLNTTRAVCVSHYEISWVNNHTSEVITSPLTAQDTPVYPSLLPCTTYTAVVQPWNDKTRLIPFNQTVTTGYIEAKLQPHVQAIPRGLNVSWEVTNRYCFTKARVLVDDLLVTHVTGAETYKVLKDMVPCKYYKINLQNIHLYGGWAARTRNIREKVEPEKLPALKEAKVVSVTNNSAIVQWHFTKSSSNDCKLESLVTSCSPEPRHSIPALHSPPFEVNITGLSPNTKYKCVGVLRNEAGDSAGTVVEFDTSEGAWKP